MGAGELVRAGKYVVTTQGAVIMADKTRIYAVTDSKTKTVALVEASNPAQARGHCARNQYSAEVAGQKQLVELMGKGVKVEVAGAEPESADLPGLA